LDILKKVSIIFNYKIFKLTLYKLGLIPSSLSLVQNSNTKLPRAIGTKKNWQKDWVGILENVFLIMEINTLPGIKKSTIIIFKE